MELRQLRYFVAAAEKLNFSEAARKLNISQSTLSQQISSLEGEIGTRLFERNRHSMFLTDTGQELLPYALRTLNEATSCVDRMKDVMKMECGEINIGTTFTFSPLLQDTVLEFMHKFPNIKLNIFCKSMEELLDMLLHRDIDVAMSYKPLNANDNIEPHILFDSELCVVMSKGHPLANKKVLAFDELKPFPVCLPAKGLYARNAIDRLLADNTGPALNVRLEINDIHILLNLVAQSRLLTFLSRATVANQSRVKGIPLAMGATMQGAFHIVKGSYMKHATRTFLDMLCKNKTFSTLVQTHTS